MHRKPLSLVPLFSTGHRYLFNIIADYGGNYNSNTPKTAVFFNSPGAEGWRDFSRSRRLGNLHLVAAGFGGSQIWLKPGEEMTVEELLKAVAVQSANDATVCLAEYVRCV